MAALFNQLLEIIISKIAALSRAILKGLNLKIINHEYHELFRYFKKRLNYNILDNYIPNVMAPHL